MIMMDDRYKVKFAKHIAELASEKPDDEEVPEYFVENELFVAADTVDQIIGRLSNAL